MSQEILSMKLISGEEIIGRVEENDDDYITLSKVRLIQMVQTGPQQMGMAMAPYLATNIDGDIRIKQTAVMTAPVAPSEDAEKPYIQQTTTIALAP